MKNLIRKLFNHHRFELIELDFGDLYTSSDDRKYYWLVIEQNDASNVLELQDEWFEKCKERISSKEFDKNTSLLILANNDKNEIKKQEILLIEEDPFQFKKYVLLFNSKSLKQLIEQSENGEPKKLLDLIVDEKVFNEYKTMFHEYNWRHLLYHLAQKLPFLKINVKVNQDLDNLFFDAKESLTKNELLDYSEFIEKHHEEGALTEIDNLDLDELIELLDNTENGN
jgi:hypothetical protein